MMVESGSRHIRLVQLVDGVQNRLKIKKLFNSEA